jgi:anti-sigma regulatory factor (Ser/Thr protein kinase)
LAFPGGGNAGDVVTRQAVPPRGRSTTVRLRPVVEAARAAREAVDRVLGDDDFRQVRFRARLLSTELVTNSVLHADLGPLDAITLVLDVRDGLIRIEVRDAGSGFRPHVAASGPTAQPGRGLLLVGALADRWGFTRSGPTRVWFELDLDGD